jgi:hypothetical protein
VDKIQLTAQDFVDTDFVMVRPRLVAKFGGNVAAVLVIARVQFRAQIMPISDDGYQWWRATYADLSAETGLSPQQVRRVIDTLVEQGIVLAKIDNQSSWDRTRSYRVQLSDLHVSDPTHASVGSDTSISRIRHIDQSDPTHLPYIQEGFKKDKKQSPAPAEPDMFDEFWKVYPAKKSKIAAKKAWAKAIKVASADQIIAGAMVYRTDARVLAGYVKNPATWLSGGCWDDEPSVPQPQAARRSELVEHGGMQLTRRNAEALERIARISASGADLLAIGAGEGAPW